MSCYEFLYRDKNKVEPLELIYHKVPQSMIPVFDGAVECKIGDPNDQNLIVRFDFGLASF